MHPDVYGWSSLLDNYWEPHRHTEPFAKCWRNPTLLREFDWSISNNFVTSISCPLGIPNSIENPMWNPDPGLFAKYARQLGINVQFAVVGREQNILAYQQSRIRTEETLLLFLDRLAQIDNPTFLSYELLYLYKEKYLQSLSLNIPIAYSDNRLNTILECDANKKYTHAIEHNILDNGNKHSTIFKDRP